LHSRSVESVGAADWNWAAEQFCTAAHLAFNVAVHIRVWYVELPQVMQFVQTLFEVALPAKDIHVPDWQPLVCAHWRLLVAVGATAWYSLERHTVRLAQPVSLTDVAATSMYCVPLQTLAGVHEGTFPAVPLKNPLGQEAHPTSDALVPSAFMKKPAPHTESTWQTVTPVRAAYDPVEHAAQGVAADRSVSAEPTAHWKLAQGPMEPGGV